MVINEGNERLDNIKQIAERIDKLEDCIKTLRSIQLDMVRHESSSIDIAFNEAIGLMKFHRDSLIQMLKDN